MTPVKMTLGQSSIASLTIAHTYSCTYGNYFGNSYEHKILEWDKF
jgi:hypothetical protein